jgi:hypothetical protein
MPNLDAGLVACLCLGAFLCEVVFVIAWALFQGRLDDEFDRGFRAGRNPEARPGRYWNEVSTSR